jgi:hypothetical protein
MCNKPKKYFNSMHCFQFYFCLVVNSAFLFYLQLRQNFMEGRLAATALFFAIIAACSKTDLQGSQQVQISQGTQENLQKEIYTSPWKTIPAWTAKKREGATVFSYKHNTPELQGDLIKNGVVLVFARNLWPKDGAKEFDDKTDKPLLMPFYFLPYFEKPNYTEEWSYVAADKNLELTLAVKGGNKVLEPGKNIQWRLIAIPLKKLQEKKQNSRTVRKLSYDELVQLFHLS